MCYAAKVYTRTQGNENVNYKKSDAIIPYVQMQIRLATRKAKTKNITVACLSRKMTIHQAKTEGSIAGPSQKTYSRCNNNYGL
jgi:hypothetical protein